MGHKTLLPLTTWSYPKYFEREEFCALDTYIALGMCITIKIYYRYVAILITALATVSQYDIRTYITILVRE